MTQSIEFLAVAYRFRSVDRSQMRQDTKPCGAKLHLNSESGWLADYYCMRPTGHTGMHQTTALGDHYNRDVEVVCEWLG